VRDGTEPSRRDRLVGAFQRFLRTEASGGILLLAATIVALLWANLASGSYERAWTTTLTLGSGDRAIANDLRHWINEAAMALFFFVVALEVKRELVAGELRDRRAAALPIIAALGGMIVPALVYFAVSGGGPGGRGWGIPMATDIAFAVGVLTLFGRRIPTGLKLFLLTLAIVDDLGAIVVIAIAYTEAISLEWLALAVGLLGLFALIRHAPRLVVPLQIVAAIALWVTVHEAGVHATIAGVALAFATPADAEARLEGRLHPWTSYLIVPLFALANAGVVFAADAFDTSASARVAAGVAAGLVAGKLAGIALGAFASTRLGIARLPAGVGWRHIAGAAALGGIGFTVSLFIAGLAFPDGELLDAAKIGVLAGSVVAGSAGAWLLSRAAPRGAEDRSPRS
jgi:Na+:H+ antiporter, NhaA family